MIQITCEICKDLIPWSRTAWPLGTAPPQWSGIFKAVPSAE